MQSPDQHVDAKKSGLRPHHLLLAIPFVWQLGLAPFINDVVVPGLPLPFPMVWQMAGVVLTSVVVAAVYLIDRRREDAQGADDVGRDPS